LYFQRGTEKYQDEADLAAGKKNKWGVAYYKQEYPERELDDDVVRDSHPHHKHTNRSIPITPICKICKALSHYKEKKKEYANITFHFFEI
jgi:hypothetical protein